MTRDEGVIKFDCDWQQSAPPDASLTQEIAEFRNRLFELNLIGVYPDGIGFGNISVRLQPPHKFLISASQTGHIPSVSAEHFTYVSGYDIDKNWIACQGPIKASSESLTHAMIYESFPKSAAVIHIHNNKVWDRLKNKVPTSRADVPYGTPAMGHEVERLKRESELPRLQIFVMAGHEDGVISFGKDLKEAFEVLTLHIGPILATAHPS